MEFWKDTWTLTWNYLLLPLVCLLVVFFFGYGVGQFVAAMDCDARLHEVCPIKEKTKILRDSYNR